MDKTRITDQYFINSRNKPIISAKLIPQSAIELKQINNITKHKNQYGFKFRVKPLD